MIWAARVRLPALCRPRLVCGKRETLELAGGVGRALDLDAGPDGASDEAVVAIGATEAKGRVGPDFLICLARTLLY